MFKIKLTLFSNISFTYSQYIFKGKLIIGDRLRYYPKQYTFFILWWTNTNHNNISLLIFAQYLIMFDVNDTNKKVKNKLIFYFYCLGRKLQVCISLIQL